MGMEKVLKAAVEFVKSDWIKKIVIPITTVLASGFFSWMIARDIAQDAANKVLQDELDQGRAVFENIGFRYFNALSYLYRANEDEKRLEPSEDPKILLGYQAILADIQEDIAWLRRNPIYGRLQKNSNLPNSKWNFSLVQNYLAKEIVSQEAEATRETSKLMCEIYIHSNTLQNSAIIDPERNIVTQSKRTCATLEKYAAL